MTTPDPTDGTSDPRDLLAAYALDAVDDLDRRRVEDLVATDPDAAHELETLRATAAMLGTATSAAPPSQLRRSVLDRISQEGQVPAPAPVAGERSTVRRRPRRTFWVAVAAAALVAAAVPSVLAWRQTQEVHRVQAQQQEVVDLLADPLAQVRRADVPGGGTVVGVLSRDRALFTASGLQEPGPGKVYQLWVVRDGIPVPDAVMAAGARIVRATPDDYVVLTHRYAAGDSLAVTVEPTGGSLKPTSKPIVVLTPV
ncbi:anti-sigma factor [Cellulomonas sp. SG140]|uniref:anti-sigma factor n=1 Tax=Cellulomonas sp. SG140 TaxID=2976536 RepID=UPI0021E7E82B|nr:anti-sigma factor [Cellulomonas sp. SG140]